MKKKRTRYGMKNSKKKNSKKKNYKRKNSKKSRKKSRKRKFTLKGGSGVSERDRGGRAAALLRGGPEKSSVIPEISMPGPTLKRIQSTKGNECPQELKRCNARVKESSSKIAELDIIIESLRRDAMHNKQLARGHREARARHETELHKQRLAPPGPAPPGLAPPRPDRRSRDHALEAMMNRHASKPPMSAVEQAALESRFNALNTSAKESDQSVDALLEARFNALRARDEGHERPADVVAAAKVVGTKTVAPEPRRMISTESRDQPKRHGAAGNAPDMAHEILPITGRPTGEEDNTPDDEYNPELGVW